MISDFFRKNRDPSLQYADGRDYGRNGTITRITRRPGYNKDGTPKTKENNNK
ncbi:MAG: hypothetical protein FWG41_03965 [Methanomassiliicoccaceae archaeon]|nr:hypothetical protein [Methanomassiliicoccaceae archaeon]